MSVDKILWIILLSFRVIKVSQCNTKHERATTSSMIIGTGTFEKFLNECDELFQVDNPEISIKMEQVMKNKNISEAWIPIRKHNFAYLSWLNGRVFDDEAHRGIEHYDCGNLDLTNQFVIDTRICYHILPSFLCDMTGNTLCNKQRALCIALEGQTFAIFKQQSTWYTARDMCKREGYQLASINKQLMDPLLAELRNLSIKYAWIGLRKAEFIILSYKKKCNIVNRTLENSNWNIDQPQTCPGCSCGLAVLDETSSLKWSTRECNAQFPFICGSNKNSTISEVRVEYNIRHYTLVLCISSFLLAVLLLISWIGFYCVYQKINNRDKDEKDQEDIPLLDKKKREKEEDKYFLNIEILEKISQFMTEIIEEDQNVEKHKIMLPTFIKYLPTNEQLGDGRFLSLALCDKKNFTLSTIDVANGRVKTEDKQKKTIPDDIFDKKSPGIIGKLFHHIAEVAVSFIEEKSLPITGIGFTCALPCTHMSLNDAVIEEFKKDMPVPEEDMKGEANVANMLEKEIIESQQKKKLTGKEKSLDCLAVISDTSDCFMSYSYTEGTECVAAVVLDTGTNACYWKTTSENAAANANNSIEGELINTEWGAFGDFKDKEKNIIKQIRKEVDMELDKESSNQGKAIFEKMVSGLYVSELCHRLIFSYLRDDSSIFPKDQCMDFEHIEMIVSSQDNARHILNQFFPKEVKENHLDYIRLNICKPILRRSANLAAAGIAALLRQCKLGEKQSFTVVMAGRLWSLQYYEEDIRYTVDQLFQSKGKVRFVKTDHGTGKGAALVASIVTKQKNTKQSQVTNPDC